MATHFNIPAWEVPWTEEPGRLQPMVLQRVGHNIVTKQQQQRILLPSDYFSHCCKIYFSCETHCYVCFAANFYSSLVDIRGPKKFSLYHLSNFISVF